MNEVDLLRGKIDEMSRELEAFKRNRFADLSSEEIEKLKNYLFDRTAATLASGAVVKYLILTQNGIRRAIPYYNKFSPIA
jgi:predicted nuclease with TOPRIM domain